MPVDVASGVQSSAAHVEVWALVPLVYRRTYTSARLTKPLSSLGRGWIHGVDVRLVRDLDGFDSSTRKMPRFPSRLKALRGRGGGSLRGGQ
jgi:hypothetical protein